MLCFPLPNDQTGPQDAPNVARLTRTKRIIADVAYPGRPPPS